MTLKKSLKYSDKKKKVGVCAYNLHFYSTTDPNLLTAVNNHVKINCMSHVILVK